MVWTRGSTREPHAWTFKRGPKLAPLKDLKNFETEKRDCGTSLNALNSFDKNTFKSYKKLKFLSKTKFIKKLIFKTFSVYFRKLSTTIS